MASSIGSRAASVAMASVKFSGGPTMSQIAAGLPSSSASDVLGSVLPHREAFFQGSIKQGIFRALKKTFLRPIRGWVLTLGLAPFTSGLSLLFAAKSFVEGLVGVDSLVMKRRIGINFKKWFGINFGVSKEFNGRTLVGAFKSLIK